MRINQLDKMLKVLRLGHRRERDKRMTTHTALTARALGADEFIFTGDKDKKLLKNIRDVVDRFGGAFTLRHSKDWKKTVDKFKEKGKVVHLTMYGEKIQNLEREIKKMEKCLVIIGGKKVPGEAYETADYNIAVTNQPHSEVSSLAVFLDRYYNGEELDFEFQGGKIEIKPNQSGKTVKENQKE